MCSSDLSAVDCHMDRGSGCSRLGYGISPLGGVFLGEENLSQPLVSAQLEVKLSLGLLAGVGDIS